MSARSSVVRHLSAFCFFFFNDTATTEIYTLSLHDALPISDAWPRPLRGTYDIGAPKSSGTGADRSEEHTSELQSHSDLVCRLLLEKKKKNKTLATKKDNKEQGGKEWTKRNAPTTAHNETA